MVEERVPEADDVGCCPDENAIQGGNEGGIGRIIGPEGEYSAGVKMGGQGA